MFHIHLRLYPEFAWRFYLAERKDDILDNLNDIISMLDYVLDTNKKRHIVGGILLSASLLFGGLAVTVFTIKSEDDDNE